MKSFKKIIVVLIALFFVGTPLFAADYHVLINNQQQGPISIEQLQQMASDGVVTRDTMVWKNGMPAWDKAGGQQDLQVLFVVAVPPPPPPIVAGSPPPPPPSTPPASPSPMMKDMESTQKISNEEKQDTSAHNFPSVEDIAGNNLDQQRDKWLKGDQYRSRQKLGFDEKGSYIGWGMASIEAGPKQVDFGQKRIMAFEKAFSDAKATFVRTKKQEVATEVTRNFFHDDKEKNDIELKDGRLVGIGKKLAALTEATLDQALIDLGVEPKDIENSNIAQKRTLAENSLSKTITIKAVQRIPGIRILATFEDVKGVGVLIKQNRNYSNLASAIASHKLIGYPSKTDPVDDIVNQLEQKFIDNKDYIPQYGVRIMVDEVGNRVLVSFGQWSPKVTKSDSRMKINMAVKAAKDIAYNEALSYMTQFVNTTLALKDDTRLKDSDTVRKITRTNRSVENVKNSSVGASIDKFIKETSNISLEGVTETMNWAVNHPETGHLIVGKVLMWSPLTQEYARQKPQRKTYQPVQSTQQKKEREFKSNIRKSVDIGDKNF